MIGSAKDLVMFVPSRHHTASQRTLRPIALSKQITFRNSKILWISIVVLASVLSNGRNVGAQEYRYPQPVAAWDTSDVSSEFYSYDSDYDVPSQTFSDANTATYPFVDSGEVECVSEQFYWEFLPREALYPFYLADTKQSRMAGQWIEATNDSTLLDATLGGRFGIWRYVDGTQGPLRRGIQLDFEGSGQVRLDMTNEHDVRSVDFRAGLPVSFSFGRVQARTGYYHISSHLGDEFLIKNPGYDRKNYVRDALLVGLAYWIDDSKRIYGEATWAFYADLADPWEIIFGIEDAPRTPTGIRGAPFVAMNGRLRQEIDFSGEFTLQAGWAWKSSNDNGLLRVGLHYFNGLSNQFSFYQDHEELIGAGIWYDF